jgi:hypothetical protein
MGQEIASVYAEYGNYTSPNSPFMDCGRISMRTEGNGLASFDMYFCNRMPYPSWQLEREYSLYLSGRGGSSACTGWKAIR